MVDFNQALGVGDAMRRCHEFAAHLLRVTPTAHWLEWVDWAYPIQASPVQPTPADTTQHSSDLSVIIQDVINGRMSRKACP
jgi:hypothetical protein